jgi:oxaloacetate decarboxylase gamma subunit
MEEVSLVAESLKFMILGMGIVFVFLTIMVFALQFQAKLIEKYLIKEDTPKPSTNKWQPTTSNEDEEKALTAAITAAILHHNHLKLKGE